MSVLGGRIKNSCSERKIARHLRLPEMGGPPQAAPPDAVHLWQRYRRWRKDHVFRLSF